MNELQVKTIELEPAKVVFNHEEIEKDLDKNLEKYSSLTFTEETVKDCNDTIAELRKGKKAVDRYRIDTKKQLTEPVAAFEKKCKALEGKFDNVISPLVEQSNAFEEKRRNEKLEKVQEIVAQTIEDFELEEKYAVEMEIPDSFLTKSKTIKSITEELETTAQHLEMKQDKSAADKELIKTTVEFVNNRYEVSLSKTAYISLLDFKDVKEIKTQILDDGQNEMDKKIQAEKRKQEQLEQETQVPIERSQNEPKTVLDTINIESTPYPFDDDFIPVEPVDAVKVFEVYKATGTDAQLKELEGFMDEIGIDWEVMSDD